MLDSLRKNDLVIIIVSGGGSTLLCLPEAGGTCVEEGLVLQQLFLAGANIQDINTIRKHLSFARGGFLAKHAYPAQVISLIFSDVPGNDFEYIASGPTIKDTSTVDDADAILAKYGILKACGLQRCGLIETPKEDKYFERVQNILLVSNDLALKAMAEKAAALGYAPTICTNSLTGEAREVGVKVAKELHASSRRVARLYGGETTVTVRHSGKGGRSQELALSAMAEIKPEEIIIAFATDGRDNTDAAGAICDTMIKERAMKLGLDPKIHLETNSSYDFFEKTGGHIMTGYTGSNVSDLLIALKE
jgi:glycerate 2-kinase